MADADPSAAGSVGTATRCAVATRGDRAAGRAHRRRASRRGGRRSEPDRRPQPGGRTARIVDVRPSGRCVARGWTRPSAMSLCAAARGPAACRWSARSDAAADLTVAHTREREQFGRPLRAFQAVQHSLAAMAGEIERARAATTLAIAAAADYGFGSPQTDYAVTVAKVAVGRAVEPVTTIAHQLHGAIGVTRRAPTVAGHHAGAKLGRRFRQHRALRAAARPHDAGGRRSVGRRRQLSSTSLTRASTSPRPVRSMPNRSVSASTTCGRGIEADALAATLAVDGEVAAAQIPARIVGDERDGQPGDETRLPDTLTRTNFRPAGRSSETVAC